MRQSQRPVTILDTMILVAAVGLWAALSGLWARELRVSLSSQLRWQMPTAFRTRVAGWALAALVPMTLAVLALRLRAPRPRLRLLARQPGSVACLVAAAMITALGANLRVDMKSMGGGWEPPLVIPLWYWPAPIAAAIASSWALLAASGRWSPGPDWVDRLGMLVGTGWIALPISLAIIQFSL